MKITQEISLISCSSFEESQEWAIIQEGFLAVFVIEHDAIDSSVPRITKETNGRALI